MSSRPGWRINTSVAKTFTDRTHTDIGGRARAWGTPSPWCECMCMNVNVCLCDFLTPSPASPASRTSADTRVYSHGGEETSVSRWSAS
jgi:hypothetical protein